MKEERYVEISCWNLLWMIPLSCVIVYLTWKGFIVIMAAFGGGTA